MISVFRMNGVLWNVVIVDPSDPMLIDRTNTRTVGTTDPISHTIFMSSQLRGQAFTKVLIHELGHCAIFSFGLDDKIHEAVKPEYWIDAEEWLCNFIYDYGLHIFEAASRILGIEALNYLPRELEKLIA